MCCLWRSYRSKGTRLSRCTPAMLPNGQLDIFWMETASMALQHHDGACSGRGLNMADHPCILFRTLHELSGVPGYLAGFSAMTVFWW